MVVQRANSCSVSPALEPIRLGSWAFSPVVLWRRAGFSFDLMEALAHEHAMRAIDALLASEQLRERRRTELLASCFEALGQSEDRDTRLALREQGRRLAKSMPIQAAAITKLPAFAARLAEWNELCDATERLSSEARAVFAAESVMRQATLKDTMADERLREALLLSSPGFYQRFKRFDAGWQPGDRSSRTRQFERKLISYLQRFCTKNETTSFFGPLGYGRMGVPRIPGIRVTGAADTPLRRRVVLFSHWGAQALADTLCQEPSLLPFLRPRRSALWRIEGARATLCMGEVALELDPLDARILALADGERDAHGIRKALLGEAPLELSALLERLRSLHATQLLHWDLAIPPNTRDPLAFVVAWVATLPPLAWPGLPRWLQALSTLGESLARFEAAGLAERERLLEEIERQWSDLVGPHAEARRGEGSHYSDRLLISEDCLDDLEITLGDDLSARMLASLARRLEGMVETGWRRYQAYQRMGREWLEEMAPEGEEVPYGRFAKAMVELHPNGLPPLSDETNDQVTGSPDDLAWVTSVDVLVEAASMRAVEAGDVDWVLGEVQHHLGISGYGGALYDPPETLERHVADLVRRVPDADRLACMVVPHRSKIKGYELPGFSIELRAPSIKPASERVGYAELSVAQDAHGLGLRRAGAPGLLRLYGGISDSPEEVLVSCPRLGPEPSSVTGDRRKTTYFQEQLPAKEADAFERFVAWRRWQHAQGLSDRVFVRSPREIKPLYVDFRNSHLVDLLAEWAAKGAPLTCSEMRPARESLWLKDAQGRRYTCEMRLSAVRVGKGDA